MSESTHPASDANRDGWEAVARRAAAASSGGAEHEMLVELLACELAGSPYAIPVDRIREIVRMRPMTPVPHTPDWLLGVISLRGAVVQVVDLRMRLGLPVSEIARQTRIIVLHGDDDQISGVLVDRVRCVLRVGANTVRPSPNADTAAVTEICRDGDEFVSIVDIDRALGKHADD